MESIALLMFNFNENSGILRNIRTLRDHVDEIVIVDSSPPSVHEALVEATEEFAARVYRVVPLGFSDALRSFGTAKVQSEYVFNLDADEEPSPQLAADLRALTVADAYVVPEIDEQTRGYSYHLRIYRKKAVAFEGRSFDFPRVLGEVRWLGKSRRIVHHSKSADFRGDKPWREHYYEIEDYERPWTNAFLLELFTLRFRQRSVELPFPRISHIKRGRVPGPVAVQLAEDVRFLAKVSTGSSIKAARVARRHSLARYRRFRTLTPTEQERRIRISQSVHDSGGLVRFLSLDDSSYLDRLTATYDWSGEPIELYRTLLEYRWRNGQAIQTLKIR